MNIEVLLTEAEIADEFAEAMEARDLPEKFFYWTPISVRAWKEARRDCERKSPADLGRSGVEGGGLDEVFWNARAGHQFWRGRRIERPGDA